MKHCVQDSTWRAIRAKVCELANEGCRIISDQTGLSTSENPSGLFMFFEHGDRPTAALLCDAVTKVTGVSVSVSHELADRSGESASWLEISMDSLTFDVSGLSPGEGAVVPAYARTNAFEGSSTNESIEAISIVVGPHLQSGAYLIPIVRGLLQLGSRLAECLPRLLAVVWGPSGALMEPARFQAEANGWSKGGSFPCAILTQISDTMDGGLQSKGLAPFIGQELRLEPDLAEQRDMAIRLAHRLINQLVLGGKVDAVEEITGPDGSRLRLEPSKNGRFIRVWRS